MKKKSKGFTLVELLAAIVILGILMAVSIPLITSLLDNSRNKIYISDAKKLIAQAEYKIKSNNSNIELPDEGDCIILSLKYLDSSIFDNAPNNGTYKRENSFVIVKNIGNNKYDYSTMLVEEFKDGGYKGIELINSTTLNSTNASSHIKSFNESDLVTVKSNADTSSIVSYINNKLGDNYVSAIAYKYTEAN